MLSDYRLRQRMDETDPQRRLVVTPILDLAQIGPAAIDLRLGTRFMVDIRTRDPVIDPKAGSRPVETFFDTTYRNFGSRFILYPGQLVLVATFEYVRIPPDLFGFLVTRSSWNRLGVAMASVVQPGYTGTLTMELTNRSSSAVALYPGLRIAQLCLFETSDAATADYLALATAKYIADPGPAVSAVASDREWERLVAVRNAE